MFCWQENEKTTMMMKGGHVAMLMLMLLMLLMLLLLLRGMSGHKTQLESKSLSHLSIDLLETGEREQQGSG